MENKYQREMEKRIKDADKFDEAIAKMVGVESVPKESKVWGAELKLVGEDGHVITEYLPVNCFDPEEIPYSDNLITFRFGVIDTVEGIGSRLDTTYSGTELYYYGEIKEKLHTMTETLNQDLGMNVSSRMLLYGSQGSGYYIEHPMANLSISHPLKYCVQLIPPERKMGKGR